MGDIDKHSLYRMCVNSVAENIHLFQKDLKNFPAQQICDIYQKVGLTDVCIFINISMPKVYN